MTATADPASSPATRPAFIRDRSTWLTYVMLGYFCFIQSSVGPLMPSLREKLGLSYTVASLHVTAIAFGSVLIGIVGERIARRFGRGHALWGSAAGIAAGGFLLVFSDVVYGTILGTFVVGFAGGVLMLTIQACLSDLHGSRRAIAIAEANVAASGCAVLAALSVGAFERLEIDGRYALLLAIGAALVLATRFRGVTLPYAIPPAAGRRRVKKLPGAFWLAAAILFLGTSAEWSIGYWGAEFLDRKGGLSGSTAAAAMGAFYLAMALGRFAGSRLAHQLAERTLLLATLAIAIAGFPILWLIPLTPLRLVGLFVTGFGVASIYPLVMSVGIAAVQSAPDVAAARMLLAGSSAVLMAPFVLGVLADVIGIRMAFGVALPLLVTGLIAVARLRLDGPEPDPAPA